MEKLKTYKTTDLYLSAFLRLSGHRFSIEKEKTKAVFTFNETEELTKLVTDFLTGEANCCPLSYCNSIKNIKNLIYNI